MDFESFQGKANMTVQDRCFASRDRRGRGSLNAEVGAIFGYLPETRNHERESRNQRRTRRFLVGLIMGSLERGHGGTLEVPRRVVVLWRRRKLSLSGSSSFLANIPRKGLP